MKRCMSTSAIGERSTGWSACDSAVTRSATHSMMPPAWPALEKCSGSSSRTRPPGRLSRGRITSPPTTSGQNSSLRILSADTTASASARSETASATNSMVRYSRRPGMNRPPPWRCVRPMRRSDRRHIRKPGAYTARMAPKPNAYAQDLDKSRANYVPLTPLSFIERSARVHPGRPAVVHGAARYTWSETYARCRRLASALARRGIGKGDTVAVMLPNIPAMYEAHFGVPMCGAVLNTLNTRLDPEAIAFMLRHGEAKLLITDREFSSTIERVDHKIPIIDVDDPEYSGPGRRLGELEYEEFISGGEANYEWTWPEDEWDAISLNYTSGTTGDPKGVVYHHRGAYLNAVCNIVTWSMPQHAVYLWTLPMFHCNGWTFPWTM